MHGLGVAYKLPKPSVINACVSYSSKLRAITTVDHSGRQESMYFSDQHHTHQNGQESRMPSSGVGHCVARDSHIILSHSIVIRRGCIRFLPHTLHMSTKVAELGN
jgi:hypothetical protein